MAADGGERMVWGAESWLDISVALSGVRTSPARHWQSAVDAAPGRGRDQCRPVVLVTASASSVICHISSAALVAPGELSRTPSSSPATLAIQVAARLIRGLYPTTEAGGRLYAGRASRDASPVRSPGHRDGDRGDWQGFRIESSTVQDWEALRQRATYAAARAPGAAQRGTCPI